MAFALPERWPGDTRELWKRALEARKEDAARRCLLSEVRLTRRKGGRKPGYQYDRKRKFRPLKVGDRFGCWRVISILGRGYGGRSDVRVSLRCDCGAQKDAYDFNARSQTGPCPHTGRE